jgi:hypothetical protein
MIREGAIPTLSKAGKHDDIRVQRDVSRAFAFLTEPPDFKQVAVEQGALPTLLALVKSLDITCQRYATLALCNVCIGDYKIFVVEQGALKALTFLARFPDMDIQRCTSLAIAGLSLGQPENKVRLLVCR